VLSHQARLRPGETAGAFERRLFQARPLLQTGAENASRSIQEPNLMLSKFLCATAALLMLPAAQAFAAPPPAAPASPAPAVQLVHGAPIPGLCLFANERALGASAAGRAANARLQQLRTQVGGALANERAALDRDIKAFQGRRASLSQPQLQAQGSALQNRAAALEQKTQLQSRELELTAERAKQSIDQKVQPIVSALYQARHCSILENGDTVLTANPLMDITPAVVTQLDAAMPTISFDLATLPAK
jgi:Skp family chaperone for outer membrane proteins